MTTPISDETKRVMENWALWRSGGLVDSSSSRAYELEARGIRAETPLPMMIGEAIEVDAAVQKLDRDLRLVVEERWLRTGPMHEMAKRLGCALMTIYRRLERAHRAIDAYRRERRDRLRARYSHSHYENR